jgi:hypothetical protein
MDTAEYLETCIVYGAEGAQHFRSQKAQEYPDDDRNERSADALNKLAENLRKLPADHPLVVECYELEISTPGKLVDRGHDDFGFRFDERVREERNQLFGRYGFDGLEDHNAEVFLTSLRDALKECLTGCLEDSGHLADEPQTTQ